MAVTFALDNVLGNPDVTEREGFYLGTLTFSGTYTSGGDTLSFGISGVLSQAAPLRVEVYEQPTTSQTAVGDIFVYCKGTTSANGKLQILTASGSAYSGSPGTTFATTTVKARAWFPQGQ
jgi:hypothetical protein